VQALRQIAGSLKLKVKDLLGRLRKRLIGQNIDALLVATRQGQYLIDAHDMGVGYQLAYRGSYGEDEITRICSLTNEQSSVLFVGSHVGSIVIPVSKTVRKVTAIEANPRTFQLLSSNLYLNHCDNTKAIELAANDREGELEFVMSRTNSGGSKRMPVIKSEMYFYDMPNIAKVRAARLDDELPEDFELIVMDIEGSEVFALRGMQRILSKADYLVVEFVPHHLKNVSGASVQEFLAVIEPHFNLLSIPSRSLTVDRSQFLSVLEGMYQRNEDEDGMIFSKR
jgi:FkbM family methyltransferase